MRLLLLLSLRSLCSVKFFSTLFVKNALTYKNMKSKIAFLTSKEHPHLIEDEKSLLDEFQRKGIEFQIVVWDQCDNWEQFNYVIVRNPWDYYIHYEKFVRVLNDIHHSGAKLVNPYTTLIWNMDKSYMLELMEKGLNVVPTFIIDNFNQEKFEELLLLIKTNEFVIKPMVSGSGLHTYRKLTSLSSEEMNQLCDIFSGQSVLIQPFIEAILSEGELSFIFFGGEFSHAIKKTAKKGEFRIQAEHGGKVEIYIPNEDEIKEAKKFVDNCGYECLYSRVDLVADKGELKLMELELVEPQLFFSWDKKAAALFVEKFISSTL